MVELKIKYCLNNAKFDKKEYLELSESDHSLSTNSTKDHLSKYWKDKNLQPRIWYFFLHLSNLIF